MNVEQMSVADLLREGKQAMALAMGSVGSDTRTRWWAVAAEIDLRLSVGDIDAGDLEGRVQAAVKATNDAIAQRDKAIAECDRARRENFRLLKLTMENGNV